jgi:zinc transporter ZupT
MTIETSVTVVVVAALVTALATGLGAAPFLFVSGLARSAIGVANALAAGFMIAASGLLFYEGADADTLLTVAGAIVGVLFVALASRLLAARPHVHFEALASADARKALCSSA